MLIQLSGIATMTSEFFCTQPLVEVDKLLMMAERRKFAKAGKGAREIMELTKAAYGKPLSQIQT